MQKGKKQPSYLQLITLTPWWGKKPIAMGQALITFKWGLYEKIISR